MAPHSFFIGRQLKESTQEWLSKSGCIYREQALISIMLRPLETVVPISITADTTSWAITSQWAALWLVKHYQQVGVKENDQLFCLSHKQEKLLSELFNNCFVAKEANAKALATLIKEQHQVESIIYLRGNRSLQHLTQELTSPAYTMKEHIVYDSNFKSTTTNDDYEAYLFFSPSGIQSFLAAGNNIATDAEVYTIGSSTGEMARNDLEQDINASSVQDELAFVQWAVQHYNNKHHEINKHRQ